MEGISTCHRNLFKLWWYGPLWPTQTLPYLSKLTYWEGWVASIEAVSKQQRERNGLKWSCKFTRNPANLSHHPSSDEGICLPALSQDKPSLNYMNFGHIRLSSLTCSCIVDILPTSYSTTLYFTVEEMQTLKGSPAFGRKFYFFLKQRLQE